jgi:hypothetical protein
VDNEFENLSGEKEHRRGKTGHISGEAGGNSSVGGSGNVKGTQSCAVMSQSVLKRSRDGRNA